MRQLLLVILLIACTMPSSRASLPKTVVVAGKRFGTINLGMSRTEVWKHYGRPASSRYLGENGHSCAVDEWTLDVNGPAALTVFSRNGKVIQIDARGIPYRSANGLTNSSLFGPIREKHPRMDVRLLLLHDEVGAVYFVDDISQGIGWTIFTNHLDSFRASLLPGLAAEEIIIHWRGKHALPDAPGDWPEHGRMLDTIRAWFHGAVGLH